jgi:hypothetical protein
MSPCSNLYRIQTTIPTLIAQLPLEACIPKDPAIPGLISVSVPGSYVSSTKDILCRPWTDLSRMTRSGLCVCAMTEAKIDPPPGACSPSKLQYTSTVCSLLRENFRQPPMCFKMESCLQVILPWSIVWLQRTRTWKSVCFTVFPQRWQVSEGGQCVNAGVQSKLQNATRKIPHV